MTTRAERAGKKDELLYTVFGRRPAPAAQPARPGDVQMGLLTEILFGEVWSRPALAPQERSMITVAALIALNRENELRQHLRGALHLGIPREKLLEMMLHLAFYSGAPTASRAVAIAREVFAEQDAATAPGQTSPARHSARKRR